MACGSNLYYQAVCLPWTLKLLLARYIGLRIGTWYVISAVVTVNGFPLRRARVRVRTCMRPSSKTSSQLYLWTISNKTQFIFLLWGTDTFYSIFLFSVDWISPTHYYFFYRSKRMKINRPVHPLGYWHVLIKLRGSEVILFQGVECMRKLFMPLLKKL